METKTEKLLVIPYLASDAQGGELETAVNGWIAKCDDILRIVIIGDESAVVKRLCKECKAEFVECPRAKEHAGEPALDIAHKMRKIIALYGDKYKGCIWSYDDIYPVNKIAFTAIRSLKIIANDMNGNEKSPNHFQRNMFRTKEALIKAGKPTYNYCTHLPVWYDFNKLEQLLTEFNCDFEPYLINALYYNWYYDKPSSRRIDVSAPGNKYKLGLYGNGVTPEDVYKAVDSGVRFINNSEKGWSRELILAVRKAINL